MFPRLRVLALWKVDVLGVQGIAVLAVLTLAPQNVFGGSLHGVNTVTSEPMSCISLIRLENLQHSRAWPACVTPNQLLSGAWNHGQRLLSVVKLWAGPYLCHTLASSSPVTLVLRTTGQQAAEGISDMQARLWGLA